MPFVRLEFHGHQFMQVASRVDRGATMHLQYALVVSRQPVPGPESSGASALLGMAKVAALEFPELKWAHSSRVPQQPATTSPTAPPISDIFGTCLAGRTLMAPRLLRGGAPESLLDTAPEPAGACIITGGIGALGSLVAAQQLSSAKKHSTHAILLSRNIGLGALESFVGGPWRRSVSAGSLAQLTVFKCDAAAASDVSGLFLSLQASAISIGTVVQAAGALRVRCFGYHACLQSFCGRLCQAAVASLIAFAPHPQMCAGCCDHAADSFKLAHHNGSQVCRYPAVDGSAGVNFPHASNASFQQHLRTLRQQRPG